MNMKSFIISSLFALAFSAQSLSAQHLTLEVHGIEKVAGKLYVAIYDSPSTFMKKPLAGFVVEVKDTVLSPQAPTPSPSIRTRTGTDASTPPPSASPSRSTASVTTPPASWVLRPTRNAVSPSPPIPF